MDEQKLEELIDLLDNISADLLIAIDRVNDLIGQAEVDKWHRTMKLRERAIRRVVRDELRKHDLEMAQELVDAKKP